MRLSHVIALTGLCAAALLPAPARATGFSSDRCLSIGTVISGVVLDTSAVCANSFSGYGQIVQNMAQFNGTLPSPQSSSPLVLGGSQYAINGADPVFVGIPGQHGAHWAMNGISFVS